MQAVFSLTKTRPRAAAWRGGFNALTEARVVCRRATVWFITSPGKTGERRGVARGKRGRASVRISSGLDETFFDSPVRVFLFLHARIICAEASSIVPLGCWTTLKMAINTEPALVLHRRKGVYRTLPGKTGLSYFAGDVEAVDAASRRKQTARRQRCGQLPRSQRCRGWYRKPMASLRRDARVL